MKMSKRILSMVLAGAMAATLTACGGSSDESGSGGASGEAKYNVSMVLKTNSSEFWQIVQAGAEGYQEEHPDLVKVSIKGPPSETSYEDQLNMLQTDLSQDFDGYLIAPLQSEAAAELIQSTDKPVVTFDTQIESDKVVSFVGTGNKEAAKQGAIAAYEAAKAAGWEEIKCIEIAGVQGDATNTARMEGYREGINECGGEFLDDEVQYANAVADKAVDAMEAIMGLHPEGIAIICSNNDDMAVAAAKAAKGNEAFKNTIFLGFDGQASACQAVLDGELTMTAAQNNYDIGYKAVETIVKVLEGEQVDEFVDTGTEIITTENAQDRLDRISSYLK
ncbi:MAG: sugar ABC transporter substrate-binding protein [Butyricicoccaceae bacterium]